VTKQDFLTTCNSNPSNWWESLLKSEDYPKPNVKKIKIGGGKVLDPVVGVHKNVVVKDCNSLYPTIAFTQNLSSETINPVCCGDVLPNEIMNLINQGLKEPRSPYRICKKVGKFAAIQGNLIKLKKQYKEHGFRN
jgi:DNA polymerase elongation subunit (family B)